MSQSDTYPTPPQPPKTKGLKSLSIVGRISHSHFKEKMYLCKDYTLTENHKQNK